MMLVSATAAGEPPDHDAGHRLDAAVKAEPEQRDRSVDRRGSIATRSSMPIRAAA